MTTILSKGVCKCGLPLRKDVRQVTFASGTAPVHTLSITLEAIWCTKCDGAQVTIADHQCKLSI